MKERTIRLLAWLRARLREPATYAGIGVVAIALGRKIPDEWMAAIAVIGGGLAGVLAVVLPETGGNGDA